jgi:hypothetical protein
MQVSEFDRILGQLPGLAAEAPGTRQGPNDFCFALSVRFNDAYEGDKDTSLSCFGTEVGFTAAS